jgi:hypothetical protein
MLNNLVHYKIGDTIFEHEDNEHRAATASRGDRMFRAERMFRSALNAVAAAYTCGAAVLLSRCSIIVSPIL